MSAPLRDRGPMDGRRWRVWRRVRWREVPERLLPDVVGVVRLTAAAVVAYLLTVALTDGRVDLTGALTALLVVQASAFATLKTGLVRVGAVLSGVLVAILLSTWIGLTWWSLAAAVAAALVVARALRLGEQALEAPISAMLILGVGNTDVAAEVRVVNTLIGAAVGVAFNLIYPPALPTRPAGRALLDVAEAVAAPLRAAGDGLAAGPVTRSQVEGWLDGVRTASRRIADAGTNIAALKDSRRLNPRALGTADVQPVLATGLDALEQCLYAVRALLVVLQSEIPAQEQPDDPYGEELRTAFAVVLHDTADCLAAFGTLVLAEANGREEEAARALGTSLDIMRETRAVLAELILVDARENPAAWLLRGSILTALEQVLIRLDLEERVRKHRLWQEAQTRRPLASLPPLVAGVLPHPELPYPRGVQQALDRRRPARTEADS